MRLADAAVHLLDSAVTRAEPLLVLVGSCRAPATAVRTQGTGRRYPPSPTTPPGPVGASAAAR